MRLLNALVASAAICFASIATADTIEIGGDVLNSTESLGNFSGSIDYSFNAGLNIGVLTIALTNISDPGNGGYITGFLFNIDSSDAGVSASLQSATNTFTQCFDNGLNGQPFGNPYDAGAALGGDFLGGGSPVNGIAVGDSGSFVFHITASDASGLSAIDFLNGPYDFDFLVRFRGFEDGGSDKVPGLIIPLPPAVALGAVGLLGMMGVSRRWRRSF